MACSVKGCDETMEAVFVPSEGASGLQRIELGVCTFHQTALMAGEPWALEDGHGAVLMGDDLPLEVIEWKVTKTVGNDAIFLSLGRDGIETQRVSFTMDPNWIRQICHAAGDGDHPDAFGN